MLKIIGQSDKKTHLKCLCECGNIKDIKKNHINKGTKSCGCLRSKVSSERAHILHEAVTTHGLSKSRVYMIWNGMKQRCLNPANKFFNAYGGRGITVCDRWMSFENFFEDMGHPGHGMTIDRKDNNGNYEPSNCRWATRKEQQNNRNACRYITFNGKTQTGMEWSIETGIPHQTIYGRLDLGWSVKDVLSKETKRNHDGLKLGGKANGERNKAKTHCPYGHEYTPENTAPNGKDGLGRSCRKCKAIREANRRAAKRHLSSPR